MHTIQNQKSVQILERLATVQKNIKVTRQSVLCSILLVATIILLRYILTNLGDILWTLTTPLVQ